MDDTEILKQLAKILIEFDTQGPGKYGLIQAAKFFRQLEPETLEKWETVELVARFKKHGLHKEFQNHINDRY